MLLKDRVSSLLARVGAEDDEIDQLLEQMSGDPTDPAVDSAPAPEESEVAPALEDEEAAESESSHEDDTLASLLASTPLAAQNADLVGSVSKVQSAQSAVQSSSIMLMALFAEAAAAGVEMSRILQVAEDFEKRDLLTEADFKSLSALEPTPAEQEAVEDAVTNGGGLDGGGELTPGSDTTEEVMQDGGTP